MNTIAIANLAKIISPGKSGLLYKLGGRQSANVKGTVTTETNESLPFSYTKYGTIESFDKPKWGENLRQGKLDVHFIRRVNLETGTKNYRILVGKLITGKKTQPETREILKKSAEAVNLLMEENPNGINDIVGHNLCEKLLNIEREGLRWELHERTNMWRIFEHGTELVGKKKAHFYYEPKTGLIESISRYIDSNSYLRGSMQIGYRLLDIFNENRHIKSDLEIDLMELQLDDKTQPEARRNIEKSTESINLVMGKSHQNNNYKGETK